MTGAQRTVPPNRPLRVLFLVAGLGLEGPQGGIERFCIDLARALSHEKVEPIIFGLWSWAPEIEQRWIARLAESGVRASVGPPITEGASLRHFAASLRILRQRYRNQIDIIHSHSEFGDPAAMLAKRALGAKVLIRTIHNGGGEWRKRPLRRLLLTNLAYPLGFDMELAVSRHLQARLRLRPLARLLHARSATIPNAVARDRFTNARTPSVDMRRALGIPDDYLVVGAIGRLVPEKGLDVLLHAAATVCQLRRSVCFVIAGAGDERERLEALRSQLALDENVLFTGALADIENLYKLLDVYVSSSQFEGLPTVILEAALAGVPIVTTATPGSLEVLAGNPQHAIFTPIGDPLALAGAILKTFAYPEEARARAMLAKAHVEAHYGMDEIAARHEHLYQKLWAQANKSKFD